MFGSNPAHCQESSQYSLGEAIKLFDDKKYETAEQHFRILILEKPEDFMINYYYGACRTENKHFGNSDLEYLIKANQEVSPVNIHFYFAMQYHARSNWERALKFYNKYQSMAPLSDTEREQVKAYIQNCYDQENPFEEAFKRSMTDEANAGAALAVTTGADAVVPAEQNTPVPTGNQESVLGKVNDQQKPASPIEFQVNSRIHYVDLSQFRTGNGKRLYQEGQEQQKALQNTLARAENHRDQYQKLKNNEDRKLLAQDILTLENESYRLQKQVNSIFSEARREEDKFWKQASPEEFTAYKKELAYFDSIQEAQTKPEPLSGTDTISPVIQELLLGEVQPLAEESSTTPDLIYKIQIGAYSRGLPTYIKRLYDKLELIRKIENYTDDRGVVVYTTGNLTNYEDALEMQNQVRQEGIEDAFVVPYFKGKRITLREAKELEKEE